MLKTSFKSLRNHSKHGVAVVEFLFAAPAFFILVFFVIEIALVWNDRHIMRLAAYRAARSVVKTRFTQPPGSDLCWKIPEAGGPEDPKSREIHAAARRAASKVMATITPSVSQLLTMFRIPSTGDQPAGAPFDAFITESTAAQFGSGAASVTSNPYVHAIVRVMKGLPAAWIFTDLRCENIMYPQTATAKNTPGVEVKLVYHRSAKMPYIGSLMWILRRMQDLAALGNRTDDGTRGTVRVDPLHYGLKFNAKAALADIEAAELVLKETIHQKAQELGESLKKNIEDRQIDFPPATSGSLGEAPEIFGSIANSAFDAAAQEFNSRLTPSAINWVGNQALDLYIAAPEEIKTIPITVTVRVPNYNEAYANAGEPWKGQATIVGAFHGGGKIAALARKLSEVMDTGIPTSGGGLPYVKEAR